MKGLIRLWHSRRTLALFPWWGGGSVASVCLLATAVAIGYCFLIARQNQARPADAGDAPDVLCSRPPSYLPRNPPYAGLGPHPVAVYHEADQRRGNPMVRVAFQPADWARTPYGEQDNGRVELVACADRAEEEKTGRTCKFTHKTVPLYRAVYRVRLLEARSGEPVTQLLVRPTSSTCPRYVMLDPTTPKAFTAPSPEEYAEALATAVTEFPPDWAEPQS